MDLIVTADEMRQIEAFTVQRGATWEGLMDLAGEQVASAIMQKASELPGMRALVLVGPGNNGGDGLVVARHLADHDWIVECLAWKRVAAGDERLRGPLEKRKIEVGTLSAPAWEPVLSSALERCAIVVDALLGTGLKRNIEGELADIISVVKESKKPVVAVDIPTGIDSDSGAILGVALPAQITITLGHYNLVNSFTRART